MKNFYSVEDVNDIESFPGEALEVKNNPLNYKALGNDRSLCLIFLNPSLRTRLSTQKAAFNLGMRVSVFDIGKEGWQLEMEDGSIMNGNKSEHIKEAAAVIGSYFDVVGIRAFARLQNREEDYQDTILKKFMEYCGKPVINLESSILHPLQSLTDLITIHEFSPVKQPKIVLSWTPHPKALPQAVPNSFAQWMLAAGHNLVITHPEGYELDEQFTKGATVTHDQNEAFEGADFIYAKNWSSYHQYGQNLLHDASWMINREKMTLTHQAKFMHCLPVRRNVVVEDQVIDSKDSLVIPQAANREVAAQTVLIKILKNL